MTVRCLSRADLETIGMRVISAYKRQPQVAGHDLERVNIDYLLESLLGLRVDYRHLSPTGEKLGLTSMSSIGIEIITDEETPEEESYYMLDGKQS